MAVRTVHMLITISYVIWDSALKGVIIVVVVVVVVVVVYRTNTQKFVQKAKFYAP